MKKISKKKVEEFIRVDHAGERGAIKIYEGQLLALNTIVKNDELKKQLDNLKDGSTRSVNKFTRRIGYLKEDTTNSIVNFFLNSWK